MPPIDLSIIIVNWNSKDYLKKCITSILDNTHKIEFEIIVIDSGSFDGCGEMLQQHYPQVHFIQSNENLGFARANNKAFKASNSRVLLFLNPDTELVNAGIEKLLCELNTLPNAAIVGPKLLNSDRTVQTSCIRVFPNILNQILSAEVLMKLFPRSRLWGIAPFFDNPERPIDVNAISGACLMIKRSFFETVQLFCEDYFMYSEDIDLCYKVRKAGWKSYYVPTAVIIHHGGGSSSQSKVNTFSDVMMLESRWRYFRKNRTIGYGHLYRFAICGASLFRIVLLSIMWPIFKVWGNAAFVEKVLSKWTARLRWAMGFENWVDDY